MKIAAYLSGCLVLFLVGGCSNVDETAPDGGDRSDGPGLNTGDPCAPSSEPSGDAALCSITLRYRVRETGTVDSIDASIALEPGAA